MPTAPVFTSSHLLLLLLLLLLLPAVCWEVVQQARLVAAAAAQLSCKVQLAALLLTQRLASCVGQLLLHIPACTARRTAQHANKSL
jgi:hypothetical protein